MLSFASASQRPAMRPQERPLAAAPNVALERTIAQLPWKREPNSQSITPTVLPVGRHCNRTNRPLPIAGANRRISFASAAPAESKFAVSKIFSNWGDAEEGRGCFHQPQRSHNSRSVDELTSWAGVILAALIDGDPIESRPGFASLLDRVEVNGVRIVLVEDASRFARQLIAQEAGIIALIEQCPSVDCLGR